MADDATDFYERADAHIELANQQLGVSAGPDPVAASLVYAAARFNAWACACRWQSGEEMAAAKTQSVNELVAEYRSLLEANFDEHIADFEDYMGES